MRKKTEFKYDVGDIIKKDGKDYSIEIIKKYRSRIKSGTYKMYDYKCLKCGNVDSVRESNLINHGCCCSVCGGYKVLKGVNDIATTNPELIKYFVNTEDAYTHRTNSHNHILCKCPDCGFKKEMTLNNLYNWGFSCPQCGDKIPLDEKIMFNILKNKKYKFKYQVSNSYFEWCEKYIYDFYIPSLNLIIEMDGGFHKKDNNMSGQTAEKSKEIDNYKDKLAKEHGFKVIRIDCDYGNENRFDFIKNNIIKSLNNIIDLENLNWFEIYNIATKNIVYEVSELWNKYNNIKLIIDETNYPYFTILRNLKLGNKLGLNNYNPKTESRKTKNNKKIYCFETNTIYKSIKECSEKISNKLDIELKYDSLRASLSQTKNKFKMSYKGLHFKFI